MPPLWNRKTGDVTPIQIQLDVRQNSINDTRVAVYKQGATFQMRVDYLETLPPEQVCDL